MKKRIPRKQKKKNDKRGILIYDIACMPKHLILDRIYYMFVQHGIVLWCSSPEDNYSGVYIEHPPMVVNNLRGVKFIDVKDGR